MFVLYSYVATTVIKADYISVPKLSFGSTAKHYATGKFIVLKINGFVY